MTTIEYQLTRSELITIGTLRRLKRLQFMVTIGLMFIGSIVLIIGFSGFFRTLGWFFLFLQFWRPLDL